MINKETYKRLTERRGGLVIDNCGNCPNVNNPQGCTDKNCYEIMKNHLSELEDKIMDGTLVELQNKWVDVQKRLPETSEKVLVYVPQRDGCYQYGVYIGELKEVKADDGSGNFWEIPTEACEWTVWSWCYFEHPIVAYWMPLPIPPTEAEAQAKLKELQEKQK